jgi:hypothetical protein
MLSCSPPCGLGFKVQILMALPTVLFSAFKNGTGTGTGMFCGLFPRLSVRPAHPSSLIPDRLIDSVSSFAVGDLCSGRLVPRRHVTGGRRIKSSQFL